MKRPRLGEVELEAFRGFADPQCLDLDADVVVIRGDNGTGKSSVADALLWLFTGTIPRLKERAKGLRKADDPVVNRYRPKGPARVRLALQLPGQRRLDFERKGGTNRSRLTAREGDKILENADELLGDSLASIHAHQLAQAVESWGVLRQDKLLAALDSGEELHRRLADVIGLERVTLFADSAKKTADGLMRERRESEQTIDALRRRRDQAREQLTEAERQAAQRPDASHRLTALIESFASSLPDDVHLTHRPDSLEALATLGREIGELEAAARTLADATKEMTSAREASVGAVDELERELSSLQARAHQAVRRAPTQVQLASAALELLGDECPVCGQPIDAASVRQHLTELLQSAQVETAAAAEAQQAVADMQARLQAARTAQTRLQAVHQWCENASGQLEERFANTSLQAGPAWRRPERAEALLAALEQLRSRIHEIHAEAQRDAGEEITRLSAVVEASNAEIVRAETALNESSDRVKRAQELDRDARLAAQRIVDRALQRVGPSFAEVFDRLAPHPTFTELRAVQDIYYKKNQVVPEIHDPQHKVSGNPSALLSEGHLNVVALSYFLGMALNAGDGALPFIFLDDPLQSMDVISVLGFADLCRRLREQRQLIVTTHDRRFASLLSRKLAPREPESRTLVYDFATWTETGPEIESVEAPLRTVEPLLSHMAP
jgi:chromosome segregation protein